MTVVNFYEELGIDPLSDPAAIATAIRENRRRYRQLAGSPSLDQRSLAEQKMKMLAAAEKQLTNPVSRAAYDKKLRRTPVVEPLPSGKISPASTWIESAQSYLANGQARNAAVAAQEATRAEPESIEAWKVRAHAALMLRDYQDAEFAASEAQRRSLPDATIFGLLGDIYEAEQRYEEAERAYGNAASLDARNPFWLLCVAQSIYDRGFPDEGTKRMAALYLQYPRDEGVKNTYASMLLRAIETAMSSRYEHGHRNYYFTNEKQIAFARERIRIVAGMDLTDKDLLASLQVIRELSFQAELRRYARPEDWVAGAIVFYVVLGWWILVGIMQAIAGDIAGGLLGLAINLFAAWYLIARVLRRPRWYLNQKALGYDARSGLQ